MQRWKLKIYPFGIHTFQQWSDRIALRERHERYKHNVVDIIFFEIFKKNYVDYRQTNWTHPNSCPNPETSITCPKISNHKVCDAETEQKTTDNDVQDCKNPRQLGSRCWSVRHLPSIDQLSHHLFIKLDWHKQLWFPLSPSCTFCSLVAPSRNPKMLWKPFSVWTQEIIVFGI